MAMTDGNPVSFRIPSDLLAKVDEVAAALDRSRSWVVVHALGRFMDEHGAGILATARGAAELDRGESEDMDVVMEDLDRIIAAAEAKRP